MIIPKTSYKQASSIMNLVKSKGNIVLYKAEDYESYEVHILKYKPKVVFGEDGTVTSSDEYVIYSPSNTEWGVMGFTYNSVDSANQKFDDLVNSNRYRATLKDMLPQDHN